MTKFNKTISIALLTVLPGLVGATNVNAAEISKRELFQVKNIDSLVTKITGKKSVILSDKIIISAPEIAEQGRSVSIGVKSSGLKNVESITILAEKNTNPMLASFKIAEGTNPNVKSRVKLRKTTRVLALVKADGQYYKAYKEVKITNGGCGGAAGS